jgi:hypothetical protein
MALDDELELNADLWDGIREIRELIDSLGEPIDAVEDRELDIVTEENAHLTDTLYAIRDVISDASAEIVDDEEE